MSFGLLVGVSSGFPFGESVGVPFGLVVGLIMGLGEEVVGISSGVTVGLPSSIGLSVGLAGEGSFVVGLPSVSVFGVLVGWAGSSASMAPLTPRELSLLDCLWLTNTPATIAPTTSQRSKNAHRM